MSKIINEHDMTKMMIGVMNKKSINEFRTSSDLNQKTNTEERPTDVITPAESDSQYKDELKKISDTVDPRIQITNFKIYPKDKNVELEGRFDNGINFFMSKKEGKGSISITDEQGRATKLYLDDEILDITRKLFGYYDNWSKEWAQKLNTEYKQ